MKRNVRNTKVIRGIAVGIAAMTAMSVTPVKVFADEGTTGSASSQETVTPSNQTKTVSNSADAVAETVKELTTDEEFKDVKQATQAADDLKVAADPGEAKGELEIIADDLKDLDATFKAADDAEAIYESKIGAAEIAEGYAEKLTTGTYGAEQAVEGVANHATGSLNDVNTTQSEIETAAAAGYGSQAEADAAKAKAEDDLTAANNDLTKLQGEADAAQTKLDDANKALDLAEKAAAEAADKKKLADNALDAARDDFKKVLKDNGITYEEEKDGSITIDPTAEITDGHLKTAIDKAKKAVDDAEKYAQDAATDLDTEKTKLKNAAQQVYNAAESAVTVAAEITAQKEEAAKEDSYLEKLLTDIKTQQDKVKDAVVHKDSQQYIRENWELTYLIAKYTLTQDPSVDREGFEIARDNNDIQKNQDGSITVNYKTKDGQQHSINLKYDALNAAGVAVNQGDYHKADHIAIYTGKDYWDFWAGETAISSGIDDYQIKKKELADAKEAQAKAEAERDLAKSALENDYDLEKAERTRELVKQRLVDAEGKLERYDQGTLDKLLKSIKEQQEKIREVDNKHFYGDVQKLTELLVKYKLAQSGELTYFKADKWETQVGATFRYTLNGEVHRECYDYIIYYTNGEICTGLGSNSVNYSTLSSKNTDSKLIIDHIQVVKRDVDYQPGQATRVVNTYKFVDEVEFNQGKDEYLELKKEIEDLPSELAKAESAVTNAQTIKKLSGNATVAGDLLKKVQAVKDKVDDAAKALKTARDTKNIDNKRLTDLNQKLEDTRAKYSQAVKDLATANTNVAKIKSIIESLSDVISSGFKYTAPAVVINDTPSGDQTDGGNDDPTYETPYIAPIAPIKPITPIPAVAGVSKLDLDLKLDLPSFGTDDQSGEAVLGAKKEESTPDGKDTTGADNTNTDDKKSENIVAEEPPLSATPEKSTGAAAASVACLAGVAAFAAAGKKLFGLHQLKKLKVKNKK